MTRFDWAVIGAGPAGQEAAIHAARAGHSVAVIERRREVGGECVHHGTIPSKSLRETAVQLAMSQRTGLNASIAEGTPLQQLLSRVDSVVRSHVRLQREQLLEAGVQVVHGHAQFATPNVLRVERPGGQSKHIEADRIVVASGSTPWRPPALPVDHEFILDSDSILTMPYLPQSLIVIGGGVIACEYATVFKALGSNVVQIDRGQRPLSFLDRDLSQTLVDSFSGGGCRYVPHNEVVEVDRGTIKLRAKLKTGEVVSAEKLLIAVGRTANIAKLGLTELGVETTRRGHVVVDDAFRTSVPHILAVGDVIGHPALAATSMEQGRRAVRLALGLPVTEFGHACPVGIYAIPELASVGMTEAEALEAHGAIRVGRCDFSQVARGQISSRDGMLKLVTSADGQRLLGAHIAGEGATELVHLGQMALLGGQGPSVFVDHTFNFPTLAEAYRIAALAIEQPSALRENAVPA